jgi:poly(hydroxyalkanoate) granule-associated protein
MARTTRTTKRSTPRARKAAAPASTFRSLQASALGAVDSIMKRGAAFQRKGAKLAIAKAQEARDAVAARADEARNRTVDAVSHLERVFEKRVSKVVAKLGVPTSRDVQALSRQVAQLQTSVAQLRRARARA